MSTIVTRAGKGSALTHNEVDANFVNLNNDKIEAAQTVTLTNKTLGTGTAITAGTINNASVGATTPSSGAFTTLSATGVTTVQAGTVSAPAITTSGDTNTGIFFPAADTIAFSEGGVESMRVNSAGQLLLGTATAASGFIFRANGKTLLDDGTNVTPDASWSGQLSINGSGYSGGLALDGTGMWVGHTSSNRSVIFATNETERMRVDGSGNLISNTSVTGYWQLPRGTTAERPTGASGMIRFNTTLSKYEGFSGSAWSSIGGGATGGGSDDIFIENGQTVTTNYTLTTGKNALSAGPITIADGVTVTVPSGQVWTIV